MCRCKGGVGVGGGLVCHMDVLVQLYCMGHRMILHAINE